MGTLDPSPLAQSWCTCRSPLCEHKVNPSVGPFSEDMKLIHLWVPSFVHDAEGYPWSSHCEQDLGAQLGFLPAFEVCEQPSAYRIHL